MLRRLERRAVGPHKKVGLAGHNIQEELVLARAHHRLEGTETPQDSPVESVVEIDTAQDFDCRQVEHCTCWLQIVHPKLVVPEVLGRRNPTNLPFHHR